MQYSIHDDIITLLRANEFTIANVNVRKPRHKADKAYPLIVVREITNRAMNHGTVNGETRSRLAYQIDIQTQDVVDRVGTVLDAYDAGYRLAREITVLLDAGLKVTRRMVTDHDPPAPDVNLIIWRGECVADSEGYVYRR